MTDFDSCLVDREGCGKGHDIGFRQTPRGGKSWRTMVMLAFVACSPERNSPQVDAAPPPEDARAEVPRRPVQAWLHEIGRDESQTKKVCAREWDNPVTRAFCGDERPHIHGISDVYATLHLDPGNPVSLSLGTHSSGLAAQTVSAFNPRAITTSLRLDGTARTELLGPSQGVVAVAFSRGEQLVELAAYDEKRAHISFYLLAFEQECNESGCNAEDLLGPRIESGWTSWTLYEDIDLEPTALDCLSCHRPDGPGAKSMFLKRDLPDPWFHWMPGEDELSPCEGVGQSVPLVSPPDLREVFEAAHRQHGSYAGISLRTTRASSGHSLQSFVSIFANERGGAETAQAEAFVMDSFAVIGEWRCAKTTETWKRYRDTLAERGLPVPYFAYSNLDDEVATNAAADYAAYLSENSHRDPHDVAKALLSETSRRATGAMPALDADGKTILREMCIRCHDERAPLASSRARFRADAVTPAMVKTALERLRLPRDSAYLMPPPVAGELDERARHELEAYLGSLLEPSASPRP